MININNSIKIFGDVSYLAAFSTIINSIVVLANPLNGEYFNY